MKRAQQTVMRHLLLTMAAALLTPSVVADLKDRYLIIGGQPADPTRYPYYVRLDYEGYFICGATLIARDFVLTAAHCVFPEDLGYLHATVGALEQNDTDTMGGTHEVMRILRHPTYSDYSDINDVALLQIRPMEDPNYPTVRLNQERMVPTESTSVTTIGLGLTERDGDAAEVLQEVELKVVDDDLCDDRYADYLHQNSMICAFDPAQDSCEGDSGGPLLILGDKDVQVGIVSFGEECAHEKIPGVYADVAYVYPWIESQLCQYSIEPPLGCQNQTSSIILDPDEACRDYPGAFFADSWFQFQRCDWLVGRIDIYCTPEHEAWVQCPFTCHSCTYVSEDDDFTGEPDYERSFNPIIMPMLLLLPCIICCMCCVWSCCQCRSWHRQRSEEYLESSPLDTNRELPEQKSHIEG